MRIGTLVANPILRSPAVLAKQAVTIDHLCGGRLDLGLGAGIFAFDHQSIGIPAWPTKERMQRFEEYIQIVDGVLRGAGEPLSFDGRWYSAHEVPTAPAPVQQPRPPLVLGGQSPTIRRVAAARAEVWNTHGPPNIDIAQLVALTARQNRELDELCATHGRDPTTLRRALTLFGVADPWTSTTGFSEIIERFTQVGIDEFVLHWPKATRWKDLERVALDLIPTFR